MILIYRSRLSNYSANGKAFNSCEGMALLPSSIHYTRLFRFELVSECSIIVLAILRTWELSKQDL